jgi:hypothetical protein
MGDSWLNLCKNVTGFALLGCFCTVFCKHPRRAPITAKGLNLAPAQMCKPIQQDDFYGRLSSVKLQ